MRRIINAIAKKMKGDNYEIDAELPMSYILGYILERCFMLVRGYIVTVGFGKRGKNIFVSKAVTFKCKKKIKIGSAVTFRERVYIDAVSKTGVTIGNGCSLGAGTVIRCSGSIQNLGVGFVMGDNSSLADNCFVGATGGVWIGSDVIGGQNIRFHSSNHIFSDKDTLIRLQGVEAKGIHIGNNCWIGAGVVFCDGVTIGDGCVIAANAVVTQSFPDNCVIAGCPAKVIKERA